MASTERRRALNCEAILIVESSPGKHYRAGKQCPDPATHEHDGRALCWLHFWASTTGPRAGNRQVQNRHVRIPAVDFVKRASGPEPVRFAGER